VSVPGWNGSRRQQKVDEVLKLDFDRRLMVQFRGSLVTSDADGWRIAISATFHGITKFKQGFEPS
jgi:hypothetical protein